MSSSCCCWSLVFWLLLILTTIPNTILSWTSPTVCVFMLVCTGVWTGWNRLSRPVFADVWRHHCQHPQYEHPRAGYHVDLHRHSLHRQGADQPANQRQVPLPHPHWTHCGTYISSYAPSPLNSLWYVHFRLCPLPIDLIVVRTFQVMPCPCWTHCGMYTSSYAPSPLNSLRYVHFNLCPVPIEIIVVGTFQLMGRPCWTHRGIYTSTYAGHPCWTHGGTFTSVYAPLLFAFCIHSFSHACNSICKFSSSFFPFLAWIIPCNQYIILWF